MAVNTADKILSLVDIAGSKERYDRYKSKVEQTVPASIGDKIRYWNMYLQVAQSFVVDPKVTRKETILTVMFNAAKLGLNPDPVFGEIYFIPYSGELTYQIGYKGMIKLSLNSGLITKIYGGRIFEKDKWSYKIGKNGQEFEFEPQYQLGKDRGNELFVWSIFERQNGSSDLHIMESYHVDGIKNMVLQRTPRSPWSNQLFEPEMRIKTCFRRHWKTQPKSVEIAYAIEHEEALERGELLKQSHPEIEEIMTEIIDKNQAEDKEESPLAEVFDKSENKPMQYRD